ncbi:hypothetical protein [Aggregatibacter actinomycetemcomitans]|uniref:hypothetical protein n=1 Tax=Aggregatibacter actinomycetemcomitans TaxID=714 RepID=UPI001ECDAD5D|nr:hypothetical protein [Aggregatibacter actinomycetemcomitans]MBN6063231.1 hypothetical protein [Aggregatibacter actinomycetemcomitans]MBN6082401.1 hypothetical protein [Aggregatibacter actinomycetemcomitans]MBN6083105.1 hypothetical protein [Aggregatibacter actinomycetemcomitans]
MLSKELLNSTVEKLRLYEQNARKEPDSRDLKRWEFCLSALAKMEREFGKLKEIAPYSLLNNGDELEKHLNDRPISDALYIACGWFVREMLLYYKRKNESRDDLFILWYEFYSDENELIYYDSVPSRDYIISGQLDIDILNYTLGSLSPSLDEKKKELITSLEELEKNINNKEEVVNNLLSKVKGYESGLNFIALDKGFQQLLSVKRLSLKSSLCFLICFGFLLVLVPAATIFLKFCNIFSITDWIQVLPILGLEFILIYFFRIVLNEYKTTQVQIIQLELRHSLCQFIRSYNEYASDMRNKDSNSLDKFENLIFSSILAESNKIPSTFDGLEQLSNFIKNIKSGN